MTMFDQMTSVADDDSDALSSEEKVKRNKARWWKWHQENPHVWALFCRFTFEAITSGRRRYSPWAIINRVRWETGVVTQGEDFKISNDFIAFYSRYFMHTYPQHKGFFATKKMAGENGDEWTKQQRGENNDL